MSQYPQSQVEIDALRLASALKDSLPHGPALLGDIRETIGVLVTLAGKLNTIRGKVNAACIAGKISRDLAEELLHR